MEVLKELSGYDFYDTVPEADGYDTTMVADLTRRNFNTLLEEHNKMVVTVNKLLEVIQRQQTSYRG